MPPDSTLLFLRAPRLGTVKTRLARDLGDEPALSAYRLLLDHLLQQLRAVPGIQLRVTPDDAGPEVEGWRHPGWTIAPQGPGDLGARLARAVQDHLDRGASSVVIIGSDCPGVQPSDLEEAHRQLRQHDVVLGPATDGGYWLIGVRRPAPILFEAMPWGTDAVYAETLRRAREAGLTVATLRTLSDIDTAEDWAEWRYAR
jgi:hypothetical protein